MAKDKKKVQSSTQQGSDNQKGKTNGMLFGVLAFLVATLIMVLVVGGAFYIVIHNNFNGLGEKYRSNLQNIPILKLALPAPANPEDDKYLNEDEIRKKYKALLKTRDDIKSQLETANKEIIDLQKYKDNQDKANAEIVKEKKDIETQKAQLEAQKKQQAADTLKINELIAKGDKTGFRAYFEKVDKATAQKIYADIIKEQKASEDAVKFAQLYEAMDPAAAAKIFEQLGTSKMDLIVNILKNMKKASSAEILAAMDPTLASKVTEQMSKQYITP